MSASIFDILDDHLTRKSLIPETRWSNLYPSESSIVLKNKHGEEEVHGTCLRKSWLKWKITDALNKTPLADKVSIYIDGIGNLSFNIERPDATSEWIFEAGRRVEQTILDVAKSAGIFYCGHKKFTIELEHGYKLVGEIDAILKTNNELILAEIKSISGYYAEKNVMGSPSARKLNKKGSPKIEHLLQTSIYTWHFKNYVNKSKILYLIRGNSLREEFDITVNKEDKEGISDHRIYVDDKPTGIYISGILNRYYTLIDHLSLDKLPPRDFTLLYSDEKMDLLESRGDLPKAKAELWSKYREREKSGKGRKLKKPTHGDISCVYCQFKDFCYDSNGNPIHDTLSTGIQVLHAPVASETSTQEVFGEFPE